MCYPSICSKAHSFFLSYCPVRKVKCFVYYQMYLCLHLALFSFSLCALFKTCQDHKKCSLILFIAFVPLITYLKTFTQDMLLQPCIGYRMNAIEIDM